MWSDMVWTVFMRSDWFWQGLMWSTMVLFDKVWCNLMRYLKTNQTASDAVRFNESILDLSPHQTISDPIKLYKYYSSNVDSLRLMWSECDVTWRDSWNLIRSDNGLMWIWVWCGLTWSILVWCGLIHSRQGLIWFDEVLNKYKSDLIKPHQILSLIKLH